MKKRRITAAAFALSAVFAAMQPCARTARAAEGEPPELRRGWNLVAVPCDVSLSELRQALGSGGVLVYGWNGEDYEGVEEMKRGRGYAVNVNAVLNVSYVCGRGEDDSPVVVKLEPGWNLIGNPFHEAITFIEAFGSGADSFSDAIYEHRGNRFVQLSKDDRMKPWRGYWVYAREGAVLTCGTKAPCDELTIRRDGEGAVTWGATVSFTASCALGGQTMDVTGGAVWSADDGSVLGQAAAGTFKAVGEGVATVHAVHNGKESNGIEVQVVDPPARLSLNALRYEVPVGGKAALTAELVRLSGARANVTAEVEWNVSGAAGKIENGGFIAAAAGVAQISAVLGDLKSNTVAITVIEEDRVVELEIYANDYSFEIHKHAVLKAKARYSSGRRETVSDSAQWRVSDPAMGYVQVVEKRDSNYYGYTVKKVVEFVPTSIGAVSISAVYEGVESSAITLLVVQKQLIWLVVHSDGVPRELPCPYEVEYCYTGFYLDRGEEGNFYVGASYNDGNRERLEGSEVAWEVSDPSILKVEADGSVAGLAAGIVSVRAYRDGVYSERAWVTVGADPLKKFLVIELSNRKVVVEKGSRTKLTALLYEPVEEGETANCVYFGDYPLCDDSDFRVTDVTDAAAWSVSDPAAGSVSAGTFVGLAPGRTVVQASYDGLKSNTVGIEVWAPVEMNACDPDAPNETVWMDGLSHVTLSTDCKEYAPGEPVLVAFSAATGPRAGRYPLEVCLDLYIYDANQRLVKTFRDYGCTPEGLFRAPEGYRTRYEYGAAWDMRDNAGSPVPEGKYFAVARFYVTYCPVIKTEFAITSGIRPRQP
ncbi:MAG: hypothetical protein AB1742_13555 [bacterium]